MPTVSVVTPSYNQAAFIEDTLESVARQSHDDVEHIVVDGNSDDGTQSILQEYDIDWLSEPDEGQADAVNKGFDRASGDIVGWLNSDDVYFDVDVLTRVVEYFERYDADIIYGDIALLSPTSDVLKCWVVPAFDREMLGRYCFLEQPAVFFRRHVVEEHRLDTDVEIAIDYDYWFRLESEFTFRHVDDVLAGDRNHVGRKSFAMREELAADAERVRARHGHPRSQSRTDRLQDILQSGVPRGIASLVRTVEHHREPVDLAFDGRLRPLPEMLLNTMRPNRRLI